VTAPELVGPRRLDEALAALAGGRVIAVAGDGGYLLAARPDHVGALARLCGQGPNPAVPAPLPMVVGRREQAVALASVWSKEAGLLTDRMWPGPLTVIVPAPPDARDAAGVVSVTMPATRALRALCRDGGPLAVCALHRADGAPVVDPVEVGIRFTSSDIALTVDGGVCRGLGPTVVDCTVSPPVVRHVGALPDSYIDAALMMASRRRKWFGRRSDPDSPAR
jgi:L-threonylcarbamoyladenylate synthase